MANELAIRDPRGGKPENRLRVPRDNESLSDWGKDMARLYGDDAIEFIADFIPGQTVGKRVAISVGKRVLSKALKKWEGDGKAIPKDALTVLPVDPEDGKPYVPAETSVEQQKFLKDHGVELPDPESLNNHISVIKMVRGERDFLLNLMFWDPRSKTARPISAKELYRFANSLRQFMTNPTWVAAAAELDATDR